MKKLTLVVTGLIGALIGGLLVLLVTGRFHSPKPSIDYHALACASEATDPICKKPTAVAWQNTDDHSIPIVVDPSEGTALPAPPPGDTLVEPPAHKPDIDAGLAKYGATPVAAHMTRAAVRSTRVEAPPEQPPVPTCPDGFSSIPLPQLQRKLKRPVIDRITFADEGLGRIPAQPS